MQKKSRKIIKRLEYVCKAEKYGRYTHIQIKNRTPTIVTSKINDRGKEKTLEGENYNIYS